MVKIRLARKGYKKKPFYHIVVADGRSPRDGKYIENIGFFNPVASGQAEKFRLDMDKYKEWLGKGAQPTERVESIVKQISKLAKV